MARRSKITQIRHLPACLKAEKPAKNINRKKHANPQQVKPSTVKIEVHSRRSRQTGIFVIISGHFFTGIVVF